MPWTRQVLLDAEVRIRGHPRPRPVHHRVERVVRHVDHHQRPTVRQHVLVHRLDQSAFGAQRL
jgi:hypothetical protein